MVMDVNLHHIGDVAVKIITTYKGNRFQEFWHIYTLKFTSQKVTTFDLIDHWDDHETF